MVNNIYRVSENWGPCRISGTPVSRFGRFHVGLAEQGRGLRRNHEPEHRARGILLLRGRQYSDARWTRLVQEARQWPDIISSRYANHDVGLLNADLEVAARQIVGDGTAGGESCLGLQLLGEAELRNPLPDIRAAAATRIADRLRREQSRLVRFHGADVGFRRASPHRKAETGEHERRNRAGDDLAILDEILNRAGISGDEVCRAVVESLLERGALFLDDGHLAPARTLERGGELKRHGRRSLVGQDDEIDRRV